MHPGITPSRFGLDGDKLITCIGGVSYSLSSVGAGQTTYVFPLTGVANTYPLTVKIVGDAVTFLSTFGETQAWSCHDYFTLSNTQEDGCVGAVAGFEYISK